ncbi:MAG: hypothetical protein ABI604_05195 [Nitrospirota bacterium]
MNRRQQVIEANVYNTATNGNHRADIFGGSIAHNLGIRERSLLMTYMAIAANDKTMASQNFQS